MRLNLIKRLARKGGMVDVVGIVIPELTESICKVARNQIIVEKEQFLMIDLVLNLAKTYSGKTLYENVVRLYDGKQFPYFESNFLRKVKLLQKKIALFFQE